MSKVRSTAQCKLDVSSYFYAQRHRKMKMSKTLNGKGIFRGLEGKL